MNEHLPLIVRHRPATFAEVCGHEAVLAPLQRRLADQGAPHAYLLTGPSGVGKTTVARLIAAYLKADLWEVDAATNSGVNEMRSLTEMGLVLGRGMGNRMLLVDEAHRLSQNAWDAALKSIEEPSDHLYWALATTEFGKVPDTIKTRCYHIPLDRLPDSVIERFLIDIIITEDWHQTVKGDVFRLIVREALGSPRQALSLLGVCYDAPDEAEARRIIVLQGSADPLRQILEQLVNGRGSWDTIRPMLAQLTDKDFTEGSLIGACRYLIASLDRIENDQQARRLWSMLASLTYPAHTYDPRSIFYSAVGRMLWSSV